MANHSESINLLQRILTGVLSASQQHFIHATINQHKGFAKLSSRMLQEQQEELADSQKLISRILDLGGTPIYEPINYTIYPDIENQLRAELSQQKLGLETLQNVFKDVELDVVTENLLVNYIDGEAAHTSWLEQQVNLLGTIGIANYLAAQL